MIEFLIYLIILSIIFGLIYYIVTLLPLPAPFKQVVTIAILGVMVVYLLVVLLGVPIPTLVTKQ